MKKLYTLVFMSLLCLHLQAQLANYREAERFMPANMWDAVFSKAVEPLFIGDSDVFWYSYKTTEGKKYFIVNPEKGKQQYQFWKSNLIRKNKYFCRYELKHKDNGHNLC